MGYNYPIPIQKKEVYFMRLVVGQPAPNFSLPSHLDEDISLDKLKGKTVVLAFFPLAWTPI
jgi:peroxiredoxin